MLNAYDEGPGRRGFENVLRDLRRLPPGSLVLVAWQETESVAGAPRYALPYDLLDMRDEWEKLVAGKHLDVDFHSFRNLPSMTATTKSTKAAAAEKANSP